MNDHSGSTPYIPSRPRRGTWFVPALLAFGALVAGPALVQAGPSDETLAEGAAVYEANCSGCHQPGGAGLPGSFPPLVDNPHVEDSEYVATVIREGLSGEIEVNGTTYNGVMPAQSTLSDAEIDAVIAYIQSGFAAPAGGGEATETTTGPVAGAELPGGVSLIITIAMLIGIVGALVVLSPRIFGVVDRRNMPWLDAWLKTAVIVIGMILFTTWIPAKVLEIQWVLDQRREVQDLIAVGLWMGGLGGGIWALWWAHRESRI